MNDERNLLINALVRHKSDLESVLNNNSVKIFKSAEASEKARKDGNRLFVLKNHDAQIHRETFSYYSKSIALALNYSEELALAYGNKSAFLLHIGQYRECLADIEKACKITNNSYLKVKLLCRKVECLKKFGVTEYQNSLDAAQNSLNKIDDNSKDKVHLVKRLNKVKGLSINQDKELKQDQQQTNEYVNTLCKRDEILNNIRIENNKKFGRHLVAVKDFNVGDVIFTEKLYAATLNTNIRYTNCHHCLKNCWSIVPCANCSLAVFCSENCQQKAWQSYHHIECSVVACLQESHFLEIFHICLRTLIVGLKEAGSVAQLKSNLLSVDKCTDPCSKGFFKDGKFMSNSIQSIYSLTSDNGISDFHLDEIAKDVIIILIGLVKYSSLVENCYLKEVEDILKNEDLIFLGSLLIRLCKIKTNNAHNVINSCNDESFARNTDDSIVETDYKLSKSIVACTVVNGCCTDYARGIGVASLLSLMNHSCYPNTEKCFTEDQKVVVYALQPIKKNSQLFNCYISPYYYTSLESRQHLLEKYDFICDCQSCIESWPTLFEIPMKDFKVDHAITFQNDIEAELYRNCEPILKAVSSKNYMCFDKNTVKKLSKAHAKAWKNLKQPSLLMCYLTEALRLVFSAMYGLKMESFIQCKDKN